MGLKDETNTPANLAEFGPGLDEIEFIWRIVKGVVVQLASRLYPRLVLNVEKLKEHLRFMVDTAAWSMTMFVNRQADTLVVGKFLGAATLGLYNIAVRIMQLPVNILGGGNKLEMKHADARMGSFVCSICRSTL